METLQDKIRILYQRGMSSFQSGNYDYAITLFTKILESNPGYAPARASLRLAEFRKFETVKFPLLNKIRAAFPSFKIIYFRFRKDWLSMMHAAEKRLKINPKNYRLLRLLAYAAEESHMPETVCSIYESMYLLNQSDVFVLKKLGRYYYEMKETDKARSYYERALSLSPLDYEARKGIQDIAALGTIGKGWEEEGTYREKIRDETQADLFEKEARLVRSAQDRQALVSDTQKRLQKEPNNIPLNKKLAELYVSLGEYEMALPLYERIALLDPADASIRKETLNVKVAQLEKEGKYEEKKKLILEDTQKRVQDYPSHLPLRYELGAIYMEHKMWDKAIAEFQISIKDPKYKLLSLNSLGLCFYKKGIHDLAINQFQKAAKELYEWDELKKEVIYNLGLVYETMGEKEKAVAEFKKIYEQDINYRDISKRIS